MKRKTTFSAIGGYQPFLFCIGMYFVALFFSIFICSTIFYSCNASKADMADKSEQKAPAKESRPSATSIAAVQ